MKRTLAVFLFLFLQLVTISGYLIYEAVIVNTVGPAEISNLALTSNKELTLLKIPLHLPYTTDGDYERISGQTELYGKWYSYVARKVAHDTLFLLCTPNSAKTRLVHQMIAIEKELSGYDVQNASSKGKHSLGCRSRLDEQFKPEYLGLFVLIMELPPGSYSYPKARNPVSGHYLDLVRPPGFLA